MNEPYTAKIPSVANESEVGAADDTLFVASLAKGLRILECFDGGRERLSFTEIDARAGIGKSAAQRAVHTLHTLGYLKKDDAAKRYRLAPKLLSLTAFYSAGANVLDVGLPELRRCHEETGETVNLTERDGTDIVCIARIPGRHAVTINIGIGWRLPAYATGPGLIMLAYEPEDVARRVLERSQLKSFTKQTVTDINELMGWMKQIRQDGYIIADQLLHDGEYSIAAPILDSHGVILAAFNLSLPVSRWSLHDLRNKMVPLVRETASRISRQISGAD